MGWRMRRYCGRSLFRFALGMTKLWTSLWPLHRTCGKLYFLLLSLMLPPTHLQCDTAGKGSVSCNRWSAAHDFAWWKLAVGCFQCQLVNTSNPSLQGCAGSRACDGQFQLPRHELRGDETLVPGLRLATRRTHAAVSLHRLVPFFLVWPRATTQCGHYGLVGAVSLNPCRCWQLDIRAHVSSCAQNTAAHDCGGPFASLARRLA